MTARPPLPRFRTGRPPGRPVRSTESAKKSSGEPVARLVKRGAHTRLVHLAGPDRLQAGQHAAAVLGRIR